MTAPFSLREQVRHDPVFEPEVTARDLRNAALVMDATGHARKAFVDFMGTRTPQSVCLEGAVRIATASLQNVRDVTGHEPPPGSSVLLAHLADEGVDAHRVYAAVLALAELLPERCTTEHHTHLASSTDKRAVFCELRHAEYHGRTPEPSERVYHFNDYVCEGGEEAQLLLTTAAEKIEADL